MSNKRREQRRQRHAESETSIRWAAVLRAIVLGGAVTLIVITALIPSESAISDGTYAPLAAGWCLLLVVWAASTWLDSKPSIQVGWTEAIGTALVGWHSLAALVSLGQTNGRQALNAHWLILGYGLTAFLLRQTVRTAQQVRSLVAAMIWLATLLACLGLFQYFYSMPKLRREYEQDAPAILAANGISAESDSPRRKLFEDRLRSKEPLATFALTNSLAGVLGPWLVATLAIGLVNIRSRDQWRPLLALAACAAILAGCLVLTKSRTAYLAVLVGLALVALYGHGQSQWRRLDWRIPAGLAGAAIVIGLVAVYSGGLDLQVLSESPKSVRYRIEYWQATARVIGDYPLFGCGPGNFQEAYAAHKMPQASETVADPHNVLFEMWATAGTPAVVLLVALLAAFAVDLTAAARAGPQSATGSGETPVAPAQWIVFGGAVAGLVLAPLVASGSGYPFEGVSPSWRSLPIVWPLGAALVAGAWWLFGHGIARGDLTLAALVIPQIVLAMNLLAAGALVFPAVITTVLVLAPTAMFFAGQSNSAEEGATARRHRLLGNLELSSAGAGLVTLGSMIVALACLYTEYYPVMNGRSALANALYRLEQRQFREAAHETIAAAMADSLSPDPWRLLGELRLTEWRATGRPNDWEEFVVAADTFRKLDPRHHLAWYTRGTWLLTAWKKSKRQEELDEAIAAYSAASKHYPNRALYHAQLAWTLHLAGKADAARQEAEIAFELDQKMPHMEQKLNRQHLADPDLTKVPEKTFLDESAEQTIERLRTPSVEGKFMKATFITLVALAVGIAAGIGWTRQEFSREVVPVDVTLTTPGQRVNPEVKIGPKVTIVNSERHDFGSMDRNAHGKHAFIVRNDGDAPLTLEAGQVSCGVCIKVFTVAKSPLQPGERTEVHMEWDVKTSDNEFEQSGQLETKNDPLRKSVRLSLHGHVIDNVRTDRPDVHFHDLSPSETASSSVNIFTFRESELQIEKHETNNPKIGKFLNVSFGPLSPEDLAREPTAKGGLKMNVEVKPGLPQGDFQDTINITTNQSSDPLTVRVIGNIASDILLMGPNLDRERSVVGLGAFSQKDGKKQTIFLIVKGPHRDETKVEIDSIEPTVDFSAKLGEPIRDSAKTIRYPIVIEVPPGSKPVTRTEGSHAQIHIKTTHPELKELTVKVRYIVKE